MSVEKCFVNLKNLYKYLNYRLSIITTRAFPLLSAIKDPPIPYNIYFLNYQYNYFLNTFIMNEQNNSPVASILLAIEVKNMSFFIICVTAATHTPPKIRLKPMSQ